MSLDKGFFSILKWGEDTSLLFASDAFWITEVIILSRNQEFSTPSEARIRSGIGIGIFLAFSGCLLMTDTPSAVEEEGAQLDIPLSVGGSYSPLGGFYEIGPILDQLQAEAAFDEQISDSLVEEVEEEATGFIEDAVESELAVGIEDAVESEFTGDVEDTVESELTGDVEDAVESELTGEIEDAVESELAVDIGENFIGEEDLGIAVIAEEVVNAFDDDINYESARFHSGQWLVMADSAAFEKLAEEGFVFDSFRELSSLGFILAEVSAPSSFNITTAREGVLDVVGAGRASVDLNHYYTAGVSIDSSATGFQPSSAMQLPKNIDQLPLRMGVIDGLVDLTHPGLKSSRIEVGHFTRRGAKKPESHGTAVASIIAASGSDYAGLVPNAEVFAASVFEVQRHRGETANAVSLIRALDWLLSKDIDVVNVSMAGPPNKLLELALKKFKDKGIPVVAAAGNGGPAADPMFPAAYDDVIAVTAVDAKSRAFRMANRGSYVDLSAPGVDVAHLRPGDGYGTSSGTSFAVPFVSAAVAIMKHQHPRSDPAQLLFESAQDLGEPGKDDVYGYGLVNP